MGTNDASGECAAGTGRFIARGRAMRVPRAGARHGRGKLAAFVTRTPVEATVGLLVALMMGGILTLKIMASGSDQNGSAERGEMAPLRHEAMSVAAAEESLSADSPSPDAEPAADRSSDTIVRNGITVVSPHLLIPAFDVEAGPAAKAQEATGPSHRHVTTVARKRSRYVHRARTQRQWRMVGLAASRRLVSADP